MWCPASACSMRRCRGDMDGGEVEVVVPWLLPGCGSGGAGDTVVVAMVVLVPLGKRCKRQKGDCRSGVPKRQVVLLAPGYGGRDFGTHNQFKQVLSSTPYGRHDGLHLPGEVYLEET